MNSTIAPGKVPWIAAALCTLILVGMGCKNDDPVGVATGTITIAPSPDGIHAGWVLRGTGGPLFTGAGDSVLSGMDADEYSISWSPVGGYITPDSSSQSLSSGGAITFTGHYVASIDDFVLVPAGTFIMGSPDEEAGRNSDEPQHTVTLTRSYYISDVEVTEGLWDEVTKSGSAVSDQPKVDISWNDAIVFCNSLSTQRGLTPVYEGSENDWTWNQGANGYRLPTEAEWEYACRAGTTTAFSNGGITAVDCSSDPNLDAMGWYCGNADSHLHDAGVKQANPWDLYDMHGNVWEMCWDYYADYPGGSATDPVGPGTGSNHITRGGAWNSNARYCRSSYRGSSNPDNSFNYIGFRLVRSAE